jgi:hypothetical protein
VQVFAFVRSQFGASFGFIIDLALFFMVRATLDRQLEREALQRREAQRRVSRDADGRRR